jgi:hypothetical protein
MRTMPKATSRRNFVCHSYSTHHLALSLLRASPATCLTHTRHRCTWEGSGQAQGKGRVILEILVVVVVLNLYLWT